MQKHPIDYLPVIKLINTADGSTSFYNEALDETYHSVHGAITESKHVFIHNGLFALKPFSKPLNILEVGFGTGLNAFLLFQEVLNCSSLQIDYTGLEPYPLPEECISQVRFEGIDIEQFRAINTSNLIENHLASGRFICRIINQKLEHLNTEKKFDLILYDAFAPQVQPEMWTDDTINRITELLASGGLWVSYCAKGSVRRALEKSNLQVERLPGPPNKRHMLRASKNEIISTLRF